MFDGEKKLKQLNYSKGLKKMKTGWIILFPFHFYFDFIFYKGKWKQLDNTFNQLFKIDTWFISGSFLFLGLQAFLPYLFDYIYPYDNCLKMELLNETWQKFKVFDLYC